MGRVYLAKCVEIGKRVALEVLHPSYSRKPDLVERFRREARAASKLAHPNIVDVADLGTTADGSVYFVMEYLEGIDLGSVAASDRLMRAFAFDDLLPSATNTVREVEVDGGERWHECEPGLRASAGQRPQQPRRAVGVIMPVSDDARAHGGVRGALDFGLHFSDVREAMPEVRSVAERIEQGNPARYAAPVSFASFPVGIANPCELRGLDDGPARWVVCGDRQGALTRHHGPGGRRTFGLARICAGLTKGEPVKKQQNLKRRLKLNKDTLVRLGQPELQQVAGGGPSADSCFPDICQEKDSSAC